MSIGALDGISPSSIGELCQLHLTEILVSYEDAVRLLKIRDTYDWHQHIWLAFGERDGQPRDFLIRIDRKEEAYRVMMISRSLPSKPAWCPTSSFKTKPIPDDFFAHQRYRFSLLANPTKKIINPDKPKVIRPDGRLDRNKNSKRVPITKREDLLPWFERKASEGGFKVDSKTIRTIPRGREFFFKPGQHGVHTAVEFQGDLSVTDPKKFRSTVAMGVGSAKAFGFGLLVLAPLFMPNSKI